MLSTLKAQPSLGRSRALLYGGVCFAIVMVVLASLVSLVHLRREAELRIATTTQNLSRSMEQTIEGAIAGFDAALLASTDEISRQIQSGKADKASITAFLKRQQERNPRLDLLRATNAQGEAIYGVGVPTPAASLADREYFARLRDNPKASLVVAKPVIGKISQRWIWLMARRINLADGSFGGLVYASIFVDELEKMLATMDLAVGDSIALRDGDLGLIARFPPAGTVNIPVGSQRVAKAFSDALQANPAQGDYVSGADSVDGIQYTHSYRRNTRYGFIINVGVDRATAMGEWNQQAATLLGLAAVFALVSMAFAWQIGRAWRRNDENVAALEDSRKVLHEAQEIANLGHYTFDLGQDRWTSSGVLDSIFGIDANYRRDVQGWLNLVSQDMRPAMQDYLDHIVAQNRPFDREYRMVRPCDSQERWVHGRGKLQSDAQGRPQCLNGTIQDITRRKQIEVLLQDSEELYRTAFMISPDAVNITAMADGRSLEVNEGFVRMTGWKRVEVIGRTPMELKLWLNEMDRQRVLDALRRDGYFENLEIYFLAKDDRQIAGLISGHLITIRGEQCVLTVTRDITGRKAMENALRESELRFSTLVNGTPEAIAVHRNGRLVYANPSATRMVGAEQAHEIVGRPLLDFVHPAYREIAMARVMQQVSGGLAAPLIEEKFIKLDGTPIDVEVRATPIIYDGKPAIQVAMRDITESKKSAEKLELAASVFSHAREGIMITNADGNIIDVNDTFTRITGYHHDEVIGENPRILGSGRQDKAFYVKLWSDLLEKGHWDGEVWNRRKNGEEYAQTLTISAVRDAKGVIQHYVSLFSDITAQKAHEGQLEHIAHFDALTGLPNRVLLADRLQQAMHQVQRREDRVAVVYLDLDGFKAINDHHGHQIGDQSLIAISMAMQQTLRDGDTLARIGGDEFVAVLIDWEGDAPSRPMLARLLAAAAQPIEVGDLQLQVSASLGVTFYPQAQEVDADQLLRQADQAMYQAKLAGKNRFHVFDAELDRVIRSHHERLERVRLALDAGEFVLHYQPKVNMRMGEVVGVEALIRWQHPEKGLLAPALFLPVIEDHALAVEVGEWVIDAALTQLERWRTMGLNTSVSVNIGARQLQQANFADRLRVILNAHPTVSPGLLELEILETSALEDVTQISRLIETCTALGVSFALDDFGTGYSSLTYLKRLRVGMLKIDQSFVRDMLEDPDDLAILDGVIGLAASFRRQVIAEGVETVAHGTLLVQMGCDLAQGYGIARPMPAAQLPAWVRDWRPEPGWSDVSWIGGGGA